MAHLILLRHAKAESSSSTGRDHDRALTERGHRDAAIMGRVLAQAGFAPDLALVSTARRAQETWEGVSTAFPAARAAHERNLYLATAEQLAEAARDHEAAGHLMIVGHNPGLHELALQLLGRGGGELESFPTAAAAVFEIKAGEPARLQRMLLPRDHGGGVL